MPILTVIHLKPRSAFLLGRRGVGQEAAGDHLPADTLFAALMAAWAEWDGQPEKWLTGFPTSLTAHDVGSTGAADGVPPFLLTSAFPFAGGVKFYPKPMLAFDIGDRSKDFKKVRFVSEQLFRRMLAGDAPAEWLPPKEEQSRHPRSGPAQAEGTIALQRGALWLTRDECARLPDALRLVEDLHRPRERSPRALQEMRVYAVGSVPRVTVDRIRSASEIYHTGRLTFASDCGLWFGVQWNRPDAPFPGSKRSYRDTFLEILTVLGDQGLGGERSAGYGAFEVEEMDEPLRFDDPTPGEPFVTLSRYHPRPDELPASLNGQGTAYQLDAVGGWLQSFGVTTRRRRRVWMCAEGSVCRAVGSAPWGDIVDVRPNYDGVREGSTQEIHPVWRYGLACALGIGGGK